MDLNHRSRSAGLCVLSNRTPLEWLRGVDLNQRPLGYEPNELPDCSTPLFDTNNRCWCGQIATTENPAAILLTSILSCCRGSRQTVPLNSSSELRDVDLAPRGKDFVVLRRSF